MRLCNEIWCGTTQFLAPAEQQNWWFQASGAKIGLQKCSKNGWQGNFQPMTDPRCWYIYIYLLTWLGYFLMGSMEHQTNSSTVRIRHGIHGESELVNGLEPKNPVALVSEEHPKKTTQEKLYPWVCIYIYIGIWYMCIYVYICVYMDIYIYICMISTLLFLLVRFT